MCWAGLSEGKKALRGRQGSIQNCPGARPFRLELYPNPSNIILPPTLPPCRFLPSPRYARDSHQPDAICHHLGRTTAICLHMKCVSTSTDHTNLYAREHLPGIRRIARSTKHLGRPRQSCPRPGVGGAPTDTCKRNRRTQRIRPLFLPPGAERALRAPHGAWCEAHGVAVRSVGEQRQTERRV